MNNNPPAFPQPDCGHGRPYESGMTLRDYFAAKAMQAMLSKNGFYDNEDQFSDWCYETADAMMKAREA